ncbi:hypothetical protein [Hydrogenivirga sp. 128-5-R1-1]|uniref:hypothetical protein n=1 Tax=Hydrogenivirga sp. 128-5-R1-1 TaxID=392423 RepID=UPI00015F35D3|nr:hypothetical protein [Hydrogenivirga sp. 128-5-R1-1]EDP76596.1 hypothetical protein HG1285_03278 [Hydrogenivirga sp. 128-5-R1-1]
MYKSMLFIHILFAMVWIGGMVFNLLFLHPAMRDVKPEETRTTVALRVLKRFFLGVWLSIAVLFITGMWMWHSVRIDFNTNVLFHIKLFIYGVMVLNFSYIYFYLLRKQLLKHIPNFVWINLVLGVFVTLIITYIR